MWSKGVVGGEAMLFEYPQVIAKRCARSHINCSSPVCSTKLVEIRNDLQQQQRRKHQQQQRIVQGLEATRGK